MAAAVSGVIADEKYATPVEVRIGPDPNGRAHIRIERPAGPADAAVTAPEHRRADGYEPRQSLGIIGFPIQDVRSECLRVTGKSKAGVAQVKKSDISVGVSRLPIVRSAQVGGNDMYVVRAASDERRTEIIFRAPISAGDELISQHGIAGAEIGGKSIVCRQACIHVVAWTSEENATGPRARTIIAMNFLSMTNFLPKRRMPH